MWKIVTFTIATLALIYISRDSLKKPSSHGFHRFFAWECILVLFLLNVDFWFHDPFFWHQLISWVLLIASLVSLGLGVHTLRTRSKPAEKREGDPSLLGFERTTILINTGIYKYIRHPLYSSLLLLGWGIFFKMPSLYGALLAALVTVFLVATAKADEAECVQFFGDAYQEYMLRTKRFIPFVF